MRFLISAFVFISLGVPAHAHWGHVGELAGHGHVIGIGLLAGAAALGAILRKPKNEASDDGETIEGDDMPSVDDLEGAEA